jgi:hypothetical protein
MAEAAAQKQLVGSFDDLIASVVDYDTVDLPGGKTARIGGISAGDLIEYNELRSTPDGRKWSGPVIISRSLVDDSGRRIGILTPFAEMTDEEKAKIAELRKMNMAASEALIKAIFKLNGVSLIKREEEKNG